MAEFSKTLNAINQGATETDASLRLKELVAAVAETGKKGSITLKLTIEQNKKNKRLIEVTAEVKAMIPAPPPPTATYLVRDGVMLALEDTQMDLPLSPIRMIPANYEEMNDRLDDRPEETENA